MALIVLAVSSLLGGSASSQEADAPTPVLDVSDVKVDIAVAPNPPVVGEPFMLISRLTGPAEQVAAVESSWHFSWNDPRFVSVVYNQRRVMKRADRAGRHLFTLNVCSDANSSPEPCLEATADVTVTEVGNRPGTIELDVASSVRVDEALTATVTSPDVEILGTYFELRSYDPGQQNDLSSRAVVASPPGKAPSFDLRPSDPGRFEVVAAACYLAPDVVCQTARQIVRVTLSACRGSGSAPPSPGDVRLETYPDGRTRLQWTDTTSTETGYRVRAGASLSTLEPFADLPCNAQGIAVPTNDRPACFEVVAIGRDQDGSPSSTCQSAAMLDDDVYDERWYSASIVDAWTIATADPNTLEVGFIAPPNRDGFWVTTMTVGGECLSADAVFVDLEDDLYELSRRDATLSSAPSRVYSVVLAGLSANDIDTLYIDEDDGCSSSSAHVVPVSGVPTAADAGSAGSEIWIAPYPPVVGETVLVELRDDGATSPGVERTMNFAGPQRLTRAGTQTVSMTECVRRRAPGGWRTDCIVAARWTFEVGTVNTRPAVGLDLDISPDQLIRDEPMSITAQAANGRRIAETLLWLGPHDDDAGLRVSHGDSGITTSATYVVEPEVAAPQMVNAAVCLAGRERTCELITRDIVVHRPGTGTAAAPAAATELAVDGSSFSDSESGLRLRWTDTNRVESGYRVSAGPSLSALSLLGEYPRDTTGVYTADSTDRCFEVRVVFGDVLGPPATHCQDESPPERAVEAPPLSILTSDEPVAGETVTFFVNGLRRDAPPFGGIGSLPSWRFGDPLIDDSTAAGIGNTHVFELPGDYEVSVRDEFGNLVTTMVTVRATRSGIDTGLRAPTDIVFFGEPDGVYVTFTDTNSAEDGYRVADLSGEWIAHTNVDATSAGGNHWYSEYHSPPRCIEIRAFKDNLVGPAATSCGKSPRRSAGLHVTDVSMSPGSEPGRLNVQYSYDVWSDRLTYHHEIAAIDVDLDFAEYYTSEPRCHQTRHDAPARSPFDYETGTPGVDLVRTRTVTVDGLTTGRTYAAGFAYQADRNGATHAEWSRAEQACTRHRLSPEVVAP